MRISVVGLGPVGLVTAACLAKKGYRVLGIDSDRDRLAQIRNAEPPFFEPNLQDYLKEVINNGGFTVTDSVLSDAPSDLTFLTVGTPSKPDGSIDLTHVGTAATDIGKSLLDSDRKQLIIIKSTVVPGTARNFVRPKLEAVSGKKVGEDFGLCSNPEFLREGCAVHDTEHADRVVIGSDHTEAILTLEDFYREFLGGSIPPVIRTSHENAELIKYANNAFLATKVSFINCIANLAERVPFADVKTVAAGIGLDRRIGPEFMNAGLGWGGSCFPKDLDALVAFGDQVGYEPDLIKAAITTNQSQPERAVQLAKQCLGSLRGRRVALLGLAFKPNTDDMRQAVSITIVNRLLADGASVVVYDPLAMKNARILFSDAIEYANDPIECIARADCCIVATEWEEFKAILPQTFAKQMNQPVIIDGRRIYDADRFVESGITLRSIGLGPRPREEA